MAVALAEAEAGRDLVPGAPDAVQGLASRLAVLGTGMSEAAQRLGGLDDGDWHGEAAEAFRRTLGDQPQRYARAGEAFGSATLALRRYADALREAQAEAQRAIAAYREAEDLSQRWQGQRDAQAAEVQRLAADPYPAAAATAVTLGGPPAQDPGEAGRSEAEARLEQARSDVDEQAQSVSSTLAAAAEDAPDEPGFWSSLWDGAGEFVGGLWDNTGGALIDTVGALLEDPLGFVADAAENLYDRVAVWNWDTFVETWKQDLQDLVAWDDWAAGNWQRALGSIAGNLVLGFGVGKLAARILRRRGDGPDGDGDSDGDGDRDASEDPVAPPGPPNLVISPGQLQSKFKHAADFGVSGNFNGTNAALFEDAIRAHVSSPSVRTIIGTYRGEPVVHSVDPASRLNVIRTPSGEFISGWRLSPDQMENVLTRGSL